MAGLRTELERQGAGHELLRRLELAVTEQRPAVGRGSRVVVANADGVLVDQHLSEGEGTLHARVSELPYIVPALEAGADGAGYLVVVVDHAGADIELHRGQDEKETAIATTVEGAGFPVHKAGRADTPGYGDPQQRTEENRSRNIRAVADKVTALVDGDKPDVVFLVGDIGDATVVSSDELDTVAPNPEVLSELVAAPSQVLRADEALPMLAIATGADLIRMPAGYSAADGVAAVLRYAPRQPAPVT